MLGLALIGYTAVAVAQSPAESPPDPGHDAVVAWCSGCHALALVTQQGMSRTRWDDTITWMVEQQNMPEPSEAERKVLLDYLASQFGESRGGGCVDTPWGRRCP
ncbi:MAG: hypothetical protein R3D52_09575 [Xanthobacteraceae bacterium]